MSRHARIAGCAALVMFLASAMLFGAMRGAEPGAALHEFSHLAHPLAWLGADGVPGAMLFNLCVFILPGLLAAVALWSLRPALPSGASWAARIGAQLLVLSAIAFALQGVFPLDPDKPDGPESAIHAMAWTAWWLVFSAAALALSGGLLRVPLRSSVVMICALIALAVPALALLAPLWIPNATAQRAAFLLWFGWVAWISYSPIVPVTGDDAR
jgi:hypothetical membrane protein